MPRNSHPLRSWVPFVISVSHRVLDLRATMMTMMMKSSAKINLAANFTANFAPLVIEAHNHGLALQGRSQRAPEPGMGQPDCGGRTGWKTGDWRGILAEWPAAYGRPSISPAPTAGWITLQRKSSIQTSIPAASTARFAGPRSTHGPVLMISSIGRSIKRVRPSLAKKSEAVGPLWLYRFTSTATGWSLALMRTTMVLDSLSVALRPKCGVFGGV
jgi:hypothetical protein